MGNDGFRVLRVAFMGNRDPKAFLLKRCSAIRSSRGKSIAFIKEHATLVKEAGILDAALASNSPISGDLVDGVTLMGATANALVMTNTQVDLGRIFIRYRG